MDATVSELLNLVFRWVHVVAGIMWIGHLWFFNFVNAQVAKTYDADSKKKVVPELMPRALYWFRWGAAWTWFTGFCLAGLVYWMGDAMVKKGPGGSTGLGQGALVGIDVNRLANTWGGGGHRHAAGATIPGPVDEVVKMVVERAKATLF